MRKQLLCSGCSLVGMAFLTGLAACSSNASHADAGNPHPDTGNPLPDTGLPVTDAAPSCEAGAPDPNYVLIDDMETTTHGPILLDTGIVAPMTQGYWYNSGASYGGDAGVPSDTSNP